MNLYDAEGISERCKVENCNTSYQNQSKVMKYEERQSQNVTHVTWNGSAASIQVGAFCK